MPDYLTKLVKELEPYVPGEQRADRKYIKLNTNENPYPPSKKVKEGIYTELDRLRLYPDPECELLKHALSKEYGLPMSSIFVGNGSDEILAFCFPAFFKDGAVAFPNITYSFYPVYSNLFETEFIEVPLSEDFSVDVSAYNNKNFSRLSSKQDKSGKKVTGILLPNPNAPTGTYLRLSEIETLVSENQDKVVLIDEAYIDFGGQSAVSLIEKYKNLLVVMTFSKSRSLAGLRVGYAMGDKDLISALNKIKNSFNSYTLDRLSIAGATAGISDREYFEETTKKIIESREWISYELIKLDFTVIPSLANFIFVKHESLKADYIFDRLLGGS